MKSPHLSRETMLRMIDGELPEDRAVEAAEHLAACRLCRQEHDAIAAMAVEFSVLEPEAAADEGARAALASRMTPPAQTHRHAWLRPRLLWQAAMVLLLGITAFAFRSAYGPLQDAMAAYEDSGPEPNHAITPGAVRTIALSRLCVMQDDNLDPVVSPERQREVFAAYGLDERSARQYQVDYLINPQLGGDDELENLWPEPYHATVWNATAKDALETRLHGMVCSGQMGLAEAQHKIATDWIGAYKAVFHARRPLRVEASVDGSTLSHRPR